MHFFQFCYDFPQFFSENSVKFEKIENVAKFQLKLSKISTFPLISRGRL